MRRREKETEGEVSHRRHVEVTRLYSSAEFKVPGRVKSHCSAEFKVAGRATELKSHGAICHDGLSDGSRGGIAPEPVSGCTHRKVRK